MASRAKKKPRSYEWVGEALGAGPPLRIKNLPSRGPLDLMRLAHDLQGRLRSTGGRPTDPNWKMYRQVPFAPERWRALEHLAEALSSKERQVSPAQVAAALVEYGLEEIAIDRLRDKDDPVISSAELRRRLASTD